jgi:hypothetical protein
VVKVPAAGVVKMFVPSPFLIANHELESAPTENLPLPFRAAPGVICRSWDWKPAPAPAMSWLVATLKGVPVWN